MKKLTSVDHLVIHCSATTINQDIGKEEIDKWHRKRKMFGIGYHYVIRRSGVLEEGRDHSLVGAHTRGHNNTSLGICMVGGVDEKGKPEENFESAQYETLRSLLKYLKDQHPEADILGHRDFPSVRKACPCFDVKEWWDANL